MFLDLWFPDSVVFRFGGSAGDAPPPPALLDLPERRKGYTSSREEEEIDVCARVAKQ